MVRVALLRTKTTAIMAKKKQSARRWADILSRYADWQGSVRAFCAREGISVASFYYWRRKQATENVAGFVPVQLKATIEEAQCSGVRLHIGPAGVEVELPAGWDEQRIGRLLKELW